MLTIKKPLTKLLFILIIPLSACELLPKREGAPAEVKDTQIDSQINPEHQEKSIIETVPLMNRAVKSLYDNAIREFRENNFSNAITLLERAFGIQPDSPQISQLLSEINLHQADFQNAHYWATIATKNSPSRGKICNKSWRILAISAENLGYFAQQAKALENKEACILKPQNRY